MKSKFLIFMILQSFLMINCKKRTINENTITPNQLEQQVKNGEMKYNMSGEKVLNNESDPQSYKDIEESIYNKDQSTKIDNYESNIDDDFEYSEFWRKEAFKASKQFLINLVSKQNCNVTGFNYFQPNLVRYIGNQGYQVKILCSFDCNQNYINRKYFWVEAYYYGNKKWNITLIKQRYDD
jgi:hypothetical protein